MTLTYVADSAASAEAAWALISRPTEWHRWAPHVRGAVGLGRPEVRAGAAGLALLGGIVPVPGVVVSKRQARSWTWQVGLLRVDHEVQPRRAGCRLIMRLSAPWPLEKVLAMSYGPVVGALVRRLAAVAAAEAGAGLAPGDRTG